MSILKSVAVDDIISRGSIRENDVLRMRQAFYDDGLITATEAENLLRLNEACPVQDAAWAAFFVQAMGDYIVNQAEPEGYVTAANADWLMAAISRDGKVRSKTEFDLLLYVLDTARWSPERLVRFALDEVKRAVVEGDGPLRMPGTRQTGTITETEVDLVRRILYAFGGDGNIAITRAEAEVLIAIEESLSDGDACPAWTDLFVKAMANVVLATSGYAPPSREEALRAETWLKRRGDLSPGRLLGDMVTASLSSIWDGYAAQSSEERALARLERQRIEIITNEEITDGEATWLVERLTRDSRLTQREKALLDFLRREAPVLHPALADLVHRASAA
jgi:hypothetical protein